MKTISAIAILVLSCSTAAFAQYTNKSSVLDGSGTRASGGSYTNLSAAGQPGGIAVASGGSYVNQAGFLNTFCLKPGQLGVHGIPVEIDPDNDGDNLTDMQEITGSAFSPATPTDPNNPSSGNTGMSDLQASIAGVNPYDSNATLRIVAVTNASGQTYVAWRAHGNNERTYVVYSTTNAMQQYATVVFSNKVAGGSYPWYVTTNAVPDSPAGGAKFYTVTVSQ